MFLQLLKKLATEYEAKGTYFGGDVEEDLAQIFRVDGDGVLRWGMIRALYDLGVLVALPRPADGEIMVNSDRAKMLLSLVDGEKP